jgi:hypothetical protein
MVLALLTVGCTSGDDQQPQQGTPTSVAAEEIVATTTMTSDDGSLAVDVLPLVRVADDLVLLTVDLSVQDAPTDGGGLAVPQGFDDPRSDGLGEAGMLRLLVGGLDGGQTLAVAAVFPDVGDVDSIVVQVGDAADADSFRLTDITVS